MDGVSDSMEIHYEDLQRIVEDSVERVMKRNGYAHKCGLEDIGIDRFTHQRHHENIRQFMDDWVNVRKKVLAGVLITFAAAIGGMLLIGVGAVITGGG